MGSSCSGSGVNVGPVLASGDGAPNPGDGGPWTFTVSVQNCIGADLGGVKVQGGTSGWTTFGNAVVNAGSYALKTMPGKTRTQVLVWMVAIPNGVTRDSQVTVAGPVSCSATDGQTLWVRGRRRTAPG